MKNNKPLLLCILDGWGVGDKGFAYNAIANAKTPNFDSFLENYPNSHLSTSGLSVGLPEGQMGNSEVGHMTIGSGRMILQHLPKINKELSENKFANLSVIEEQIAQLKQNKKTFHLLGLVSDGGVHSHIDHIIKIAEIFANEGINVKIHGFTDGRDTAPKSAEKYIEKIDSYFIDNQFVELATLSGRYYAMDRDNKVARIEVAFQAINKAEGESAENFLSYIEKQYEEEITDEFIKPVVKPGYKGVDDGDVVFMANFRADRVRQIMTRFVEEEPSSSNLIGITEYSDQLNKSLKTVFPNEKVENTLGEVIAQNDMKQLRIAETEKYAHVTFFFNSGVEEKRKGEEQILIASPKVATYDLRPEMSAFKVTDKLVEAIESKKYDLIVVNFANTDMVGHTGVHKAAVKAVEAVDECLGRIKKSIDVVEGTLMITADHGNAEEMLDKISNQPHTQHTTNPVPFILVNEELKNVELQNGSLSDIAPTILNIIDIDVPKAMTGKNLIIN